MSWLAPSPNYRLEFKRGDKGTDVAAWQINLDQWGITVDGDFGPATEQATEAFQNQSGLTVDGVAGLATQKAMVKAKSGPYGKQFSLPSGMLVSICQNESNFAVAAYSDHPSDDGFDLGPYQMSMRPDATQDQIRFAYDIDQTAGDTASMLRRQHDLYGNPWPVASWYTTNVADGRAGRLAWMLAVLHHNWPSAADSIHDTGHVYRNSPDKENERQEWIEIASGGRLHTPREWVVSYINKSTALVTWPQ